MKTVLIDTQNLLLKTHLFKTCCLTACESPGSGSADLRKTLFIFCYNIGCFLFVLFSLTSTFTLHFRFYIFMTFIKKVSPTKGSKSKYIQEWIRYQAKNKIRWATSLNIFWFYCFLFFIFSLYFFHILVLLVFTNSLSRILVFSFYQNS